MLSSNFTIGVLGPREGELQHLQHGAGQAVEEGVCADGQPRAAALTAPLHPVISC